MAIVTTGYTFVNNDTVTPAKLNSLAGGASVTSIVTADLSDAQITTAKIADLNVTTAKIADANVTTVKIADLNVTTAKIADANVTTVKIADNTVTAAKLGSNEQKQIAKAWVNFDGTITTGSITGIPSGHTLVANAGGTTITWTGSGFASVVGQTIVLTLNGSTTLGGINIDPTTGGARLAVTSQSPTVIVLTLGSGTFVSAVTHTSNGSNASYKLQSIRSCYNVSSITRTSAGLYTINFATPMADANYVTSVTATNSVSNVSTANAAAQHAPSSFVINHFENNSAVDSSNIYAVVYGN
jgi:hypothetical protein